MLKRQHATRLRQIERALAELDAAIAALIASDEGLARKAEVLCSIPGVSMVTAAAILAEMPELGTLEAATAASLTGLAPCTRESGKWKGQAKIGGGRGDLRRALYLPALSAARFNPDLKAVYDRLRAKGKPAKVALVAVMRKLVILANVLVRDDRIWQNTVPDINETSRPDITETLQVSGRRRKGGSGIGRARYWRGRALFGS